MVLPISFAAIAGGTVGAWNASRHNARTAPRVVVTNGKILEAQSNPAMCAADPRERSICFGNQTAPKIIGDGNFFIVVTNVEVTVTRAKVTSLPFEQPCSSTMTKTSSVTRCGNKPRTARERDGTRRASGHYSEH
jgi:hypothetical protein